MGTIHFNKNYGGPLHYFGNLFLSSPDTTGHMYPGSSWLKELFSIIQFNKKEKQYKRCIEPFSGCASWSIAAMELGLAEQYVINDSDKILIHTLKLIKEQPTHLKEHYALLDQTFEQAPIKKSCFLKILGAYNTADDDEKKALMLPFIINHSWSGILFHNSKREILYHDVSLLGTNPREQYLEKASLSVEQFNAEVDRVSELFNTHCVIFGSGDFLEVLVDIGPDDFIALDPPFPENERSIKDKSGMYTELYPPKKLYEHLKQLIEKMESKGIDYYMAYGFYNPALHEYILLDELQKPGNYFRKCGRKQSVFGVGLQQVYFTSKFSIPSHLKTRLVLADSVLKGDLTLMAEEALRQYDALLPR